VPVVALATRLPNVFALGLGGLADGLNVNDRERTRVEVNCVFVTQTMGEVRELRFALGFETDDARVRGGSDTERNFEDWVLAAEIAEDLVELVVVARVDDEG
jgi:hypothetical protein